jgi:hypothetical protein
MNLIYWVVYDFFGCQKNTINLLTQISMLNTRTWNIQGKIEKCVKM